jgi:hypothetical protein
METQIWTFPGERRRQPDRRTRPASLWHTLRLRGRRRGFRRTGEGRSAYVDCPAPRVVLLVCLVVVGSALDALFTMLHVTQGGREGNPLMALALAHGPMTFMSLKLSLTNAAAWFLAAHQQFPLAYKGLYGLALLYLALLGLHGMLRFI